MQESNSDGNLMPSGVPQQWKPLPKEVEPPAKKPGFFSRLFGAGKKGQPSSGDDAISAPSKPSGAQDWTPIDFSKTAKINKGIFGNRNRFEANVRKEMKSEYGNLFSAHQRTEIADELADIRRRGLRRGEVAKKIDDWVKQGKINKFEAKKLRRGWHAKKSSFF